MIAELIKRPSFLTKKCQKNLMFPSFHDVLAFDKLYLPLYLHNIFPELGSTLWCCIEALSGLVETAEDLYATKTLLRRAGQYLKCNALRHRVRPSKRLTRSARQRRCLTGPNMRQGLRLNSGISIFCKFLVNSD
ncbi:hypothetical protein ES703_40243 [subsurface metagenome]